MDKAEFKRVLKDFTVHQDFNLNPDESHVDFIIDGLFQIQEKHGLKYCPCRLRSGDRQKDLDLICPCNFFSQDVWTQKGECWCGLFAKRK